MKILKERYPMGSLKNQQTAGRYINATLYENLRILAKTIKKDMTYLGIISSSTLEVGTGKSVFIQQMAEAYLDLVKQIHGIDNRLTMNNIVFSPKELIERAFKIPRYSVILVDEWEDAHYWSELGMSLRQFFRKCRQLNLFMLVIIPNFFQLPQSYAVSRSVFFIDVLFQGEFQRGFFKFYSFNKKKKLYLKGKKQQNYDCEKPDFIGNFTDGYVIPEKEYREKKYLDMLKYDSHQFLNEKQVRIKLFKQVYRGITKMSKEQMLRRFGLTKISVKALSQLFDFSGRTGLRYLATDDNGDTLKKVIEETPPEEPIVIPQDEIEEIMKEPPVKKKSTVKQIGRASCRERV